MIKYARKNLNVQHLSLLFLLPIIITFTFSTKGFAKEKRYFGELVDIGSHRLHIHCVGQGSPSVIIDSGIGGFSLEWINVQKHLADKVRVCSYDRAGYGWSDPGPRPRTTQRISSELRRLLVSADIPGPYILVGHSFGGYNIQYFASKFSGLTAGLVLIDSSHPEQFNTDEFKRVPKRQPEGNARHKNRFRISIVRPIIAGNYPAENKRLALLLMSTIKSKNTLIDEFDNMEISAHQVAKQTNHTPYTFPVTILTRGKRVWPDNDLGERREQQWLWLQNNLQNISLQSSHYLAERSGHTIHFDQPEFVAKRIMSTVVKAQAQRQEQIPISKFNIRLPAYLTISEFDEENAVLRHNFNIFDKNPALNKPLYKTTPHNKLKFYDSRSTYFLH